MVVSPKLVQTASADFKVDEFIIVLVTIDSYESNSVRSKYDVNCDMNSANKDVVWKGAHCNMELWIMVFRTVLTYFVVIIMMRFMGKREIGKLSVFDLVISIMIAELAVIGIENTDKSLWHSILPMATLVLIQLVFAYATLKSRSLHRLLEGVPSLLVYNGKLNRKEMERQRYNLDDLMVQLRENKITNIADVEFALLETTGKLTVIEKDSSNNNNNNNGRQKKADKNQKSRPFNMNISGSKQDEEVVFNKIRYEGLPLPLVLDGKVQDENLKKINQNRFWLKNEVQKKGFKDFKDIFICTIDHRGQLYLDRKRNN